MSILYLGLYHRPIDPRLVYREAKSLWRRDPECRVFFLNDTSLLELAPKNGGVDQLVQHELPVPADTGKGVLGRIRNRIARAKRIHALARLARDYSPDVVQASDAHELHWGLWIARLVGAKPIYDAHEDYFRQAYEYGKKTPRALLGAIRIYATELLLCRFFHKVFCTDSFLQQRYSHWLYGCRQVHLLRNFPLTSSVVPKQDYTCHESFDLLYIGGVNHIRGVVECAEYAQRFNRENKTGTKLSFTVYGAMNDIVHDLVERELITFHDWIDYSKLMRLATTYDIGICLWLPTPKMTRNIPLKNFDYMATGLPIITSDFGNLAKYAHASGAALLIDPMSYDQFRSAVNRLLDIDVREQLGRSGRAYVCSEADFASEAAAYIETVLASPPTV